MTLTCKSVSNTINSSQKESYNTSFKAKPIPQEIAQAFKKGLLDKSVKTVDIYCHTSPDEDTINCAKVLYKWLKKAGKKVSMCFNRDEVTGLNINPLFYNIKPKNSSVIPDKALCLDFNGYERIPHNYGKSFLLNGLQNVFCLDHHSKAATYLNSKNMYVDDSAYSCSGVVYRFFEAIGEKLSKKDTKNLYCGMLSDYRKSKLIKFKQNESGAYSFRKPLLFEDKNSVEVLDKIENSLSNREKSKICKHLDVMSTLTKKEKEFVKNTVNEISTNSKNLAYIYIDPKDKQWSDMGMGTRRNRDILKDLRLRLLNGLKDDELFTDNQKKRFENLKAVVVFYRVSNSPDSAYKMSIHSKDGYAEQLTRYIRENINASLIAGGHPDRQGGIISSLETDDVLKFVDNFLKADTALSKKTPVL